MGQDRATFQQLAELRLAEARALQADGLHSGAYYLAGYALECALKAKIAADFRENEIPELKRVQSIYTHDLSALLGLAVLKEDLDAEKELHPQLYQRWSVAREWSENARYKIWTQADASAILDAVDGAHGILQWLRNRW